MRFFLDDCLAIRHARALNEMVKPNGKSAHERRAWRESGLTAFFLSKGWTNIPPLQQHSKLALILDDIIGHAQRAKPGTGFSVAMNGKIQQL
jgi:hypothetical protein